MESSLYTSEIGVQSMLAGMDVLGNNISNINTIGFKKDRVTFKSFLDTQPT